jgi:hypothetical protein
MAAKLHFAENALALHLLLERLKGLVDVIVTNENLHAVPSPSKDWFADYTAPNGPAAHQVAGL